MVQRIAAMKERVIDLTQAEQHKLQIRLNKIKGQLVLNVSTYVSITTLLDAHYPVSHLKRGHGFR